MDIVHHIESEFFIEKASTESNKEIGEKPKNQGRGQYLVVSDKGHSDDLDLVAEVEADTGFEERPHVK